MLSAPTLRLAVVLLGATLPLPGAVPAARADAPAPTLALEADPEPPHPVGALALDPLGLAFGQYGVQLAMALGRWHGLWLAPGWEKGGGPTLQLAYHLLPVGRGLHGPFLGPVVGVGLGSPSDVERVHLGAEAGYRHVWSQVLVGAAIGGQARWRDAAGQGMRSRGELRLRLILGWAWG